MYLPELKFSLWADFIERDFIEAGLKPLVRHGIVNGATSNPAIFKQAILTSPAYALQLDTLKNHAPKTVYEALATEDIRRAADLFLPLYEAGDDGFVSIEVDPFLCDDATATVEEGRRLYKMIDRPNVMIKVPATEAGFLAMETLVGEGIAVNATLVFSKAQAFACANAFARGLESGGKRVNTVISVFVSRFDRLLDATLEAKGIAPALTGIYNAADIYAAIEERGVEGCRTLFASTGVKSERLRPSYYIDELLAPNSVNTAPIATIDAFVEHGETRAKLPIDPETITVHFARLSEAGIDRDAVAQRLMQEGLEAFKTAFAEILAAVE